MNTRKTLLVMALAASSLGVSLATYAAIVVDVDVAPPAPQYENAQCGKATFTRQDIIAWTTAGISTSG